jgi:phosphomannomutase
MITASHNPRDQNGIKIFKAFRGLKLLPENDVELTREVLALDYSSIKNLPLKGKRISFREQAIKIFTDFSLDPKNSWIKSPGDRDPLKNIILVVDPANGALGGIATKILRQAGLGKVIEINARTNGDVNLFSGVGDLEGHSMITLPMIDKKTGAFRRHKAVLKLFDLGKKYASEIRSGSKRIAGAIFDADGDRFYQLEYDPFQNALLVLSGDETASIQARFLIQRQPERYRNALYINTVESDLNASESARQLGLSPRLTAVGDKWILLRTATMIAEARIKWLKKNGRKVLPVKLANEWKLLKKGGVLNVDRFEKFESALSRLRKSTKDAVADQFDLDSLPFAVGSEETGHNITQGILQCADGQEVPVFSGNGLKSALNTLVASAIFCSGKSVKNRLKRLHHPFKPGFKATLYAYYVHRPLFFKDSAVWKKIRRLVLSEAKAKGYKGSILKFSEDPDMLYISLQKNSAVAGIFIRNSGTENKISVNLRGDRKDRLSLNVIGEKAIRLLMEELKDDSNRYTQMERELLLQISGKAVLPQNLHLDKNSGDRLITEIGKQGLIKLGSKGYSLTARGKWYFASK